VVQVAPFYYPVMGGVEKVVKDLSEFLSSRGFEVVVITYNRDRRGVSKFKHFEELNGIKILRIRPKLTWSHGSYSPELVTKVKESRADIVHVHVWRHPHVFQIAKMEGIIKVLHPHSPFYSLKQSGIINWTYYRIVDTLFRNTIRQYKLISITPFEKITLERKFKVQSKLIPNGVDDLFFSISKRGDEHYLYLGRLSREKNVVSLLKAYELSGTDRPLILAGPDNGLAKRITKLVYKRKLNVKYVGQVDDATKIELLRRSRAVINPSPYEGLGLTLLEGEAMGIPSIIVGHGGQEFASPPGVSSIRTEDSPEALAEGLRSMEDDVIHSKLSAGARSWAENFKLSVVLPMYLEFYSNLYQRA